MHHHFDATQLLVYPFQSELRQHYIIAVIRNSLKCESIWIFVSHSNQVDLYSEVECPVVNYVLCKCPHRRIVCLQTFQFEYKFLILPKVIKNCDGHVDWLGEVKRRESNQIEVFVELIFDSVNVKDSISLISTADVTSGV